MTSLLLVYTKLNALNVAFCWLRAFATSLHAISAITSLHNAPAMTLPLALTVGSILDIADAAIRSIHDIKIERP
ncbi:MAG: hypothetical protein U1F71_06440 [Verrucomicrobiaceae bacterium]